MHQTLGVPTRVTVRSRALGFVVVVWLLCHACPTLCDPIAAQQAPLSSAVSWSLFTLMSIESEMLSNHRDRVPEELGMEFVALYRRQ